MTRCPSCDGLLEDHDTTVNGRGQEVRYCPDTRPEPVTTKAEALRRIRVLRDGLKGEPT